MMLLVANDLQALRLSGARQHLLRVSVFGFLICYVVISYSLRVFFFSLASCN